MTASPSELRYFLELAKTLNFSRTAERIGISQPSLSAAIKRLETQLGVPLFIRSKHKVSLTPAGQRFWLHAMELQQLWENTKSACLDSHEKVQGSVVLGCHVSVASYTLPHFLPLLLKKFPELEIRLKHDLSRNIVDEIIGLKVDVGIAVNPIKNANLIIKKLFEDEFSLWALDAEPKENATIICDPSLLQTQFLLKRLEKLGIKNPRIITSSSLELIAKLAALGIGIGILPGRVVSATSQKLKKIPKAPIFKDEICLIYRHENRNIQAVRVVVEAIKNLKG